MTMMNEIFGDGEVLGAFVTVLLIMGPIVAIVIYDKIKERKRQKILRLCRNIKELCDKIKTSR
jgi:uncharacterized membrane protein YciS (DUF1049 family)